MNKLKKAVLALAVVSLAAMAQDKPSAESQAADEIAKYREMIADGNPAEFDEMRGAELWKTPAGPKNASLAQCNLGKGAGVVKGVYAELPRYFPDTKRVQDLESVS